MVRGEFQFLQKEISTYMVGGKLSQYTKKLRIISDRNYGILIKFLVILRKAIPKNGQKARSGVEAFFIKSLNQVFKVEFKIGI